VFGIGLNLLSKLLTPRNVMVLVVILVIGFQHYMIANLQSKNAKLNDEKIVLEVNLKNSKVLLDEGNKRYQQAVTLFDGLSLELKQQQQLSNKKIQTIIQQQTPIGCDNSISYLKKEASNIKWPE